MPFAYSSLPLKLILNILFTCSWLEIFFENFRLLKLRTLGSRNLMLTEWKTTSLQNAVWPKSHNYVTVIREVSNSHTLKVVWLYEQKASWSLKEYVLLYYPIFSSLTKIYLLTLKHHLTTFDNHKASFDNNIIFITFMRGHPTTIFGKISVRKTIWDLEFSEHLL